MQLSFHDIYSQTTLQKSFIGINIQYSLHFQELPLINITTIIMTSPNTALTYASHLRKGDYGFLSDHKFPVQIQDIILIKTGKHGAPKFCITTKGFTDGSDSEKKRNCLVWVSGFSEPFFTPAEVPTSDVRIGEYCMLEGFPCKIKSFDHTRGGKHGDMRTVINGVGLLDQRNHCDWFGPYSNAFVPSVTRVNTSCEDGGTNQVGNGKVMSVLMDTRVFEYPENKKRAAFTLIHSEKNVQVTTSWVVPEYIAVREHQKQNFRVFLGTIYREESSSAALGEFEASGILRIIFDFVVNREGWFQK